jgi:O-methyltransferase
VGEHTNVDPAALYLNLLKRALTRIDHPERWRSLDVTKRERIGRRLYPWLQRQLRLRHIELMEPASFDPAARAEGRDRPLEAETMIGLRRLDNLQVCAETVLRDEIPGDFIETGVWRGGASIFLRAVLAAYAVTDRTVWVADSFAGLPPPDPAYPADMAGTPWYQQADLAIPLDQVQANFRRYGLLDDQVRFLVGWFKDTLPSAPIRQLALLRLDGDMYQSTMDALAALYPKLSPGGFCIVDDYYCVPECRAATDDYRAMHGIVEPLVQIDWGGGFWRHAR